MNKYWEHFKTITKHKYHVMCACFRSGLYWQGITHDLSKYSPTEFFASAKYFQGNKSSIDAEKEANEYSIAWQNHKAKNKHHWQYWTDFTDGDLILLPMPPKYVAEMLCDWVGAGKAYNKGKWTIETLRTWYQKNKDKIVLHNSTQFYIDMIIDIMKNEEDLYIYWIKPSQIKWNYDMDRIEGVFYSSLNSINLIR